MIRGQHAARAAPGQFDRGEREREEPGATFERRTLRGPEMGGGAGGKDEQFLALVPQLERVPGKVGDLVAIEGDDGFAGRFQAAAYSARAA